jgi:Flagellar protein FliT
MSTSLLTPINTLVEQSQHLLNLARAQDWHAFEMLLQQRQAAMNVLQDTNYLQAITNAGLDAEVKQMVKDIRTMNQQLTDLASRRQEEIASEIRQLNRADKAMDAYGQ